MAPRHPHSLTGSNYPPGLYPPSNLTTFGEELDARSKYILWLNQGPLTGDVEDAVVAAHEHLDAAIAVYREEIAAALAGSG